MYLPYCIGHREAVEAGMKRRTREGIDSPAVAKVACPFCRVAQGVPCRRLADKGHAFTPYSRTHAARIKKAATT